MQIGRRQFIVGTGTALAAILAGCGKTQEETPTNGTDQATAATTTLALNTAAWSYNADDDVYYQIGVSYCEKPVAEAYQTLAVFVPGSYLKGTKNDDGTYTCEVDSTATVGTFTSASAPIVMPINTPGYSAQAALTEYASYASYTDKGFVYVHAGCRGRDAGAPAGVVDLKAAVRFIRSAASVIPGDAEHIFTFGMSGGGAQSALMGATGNAPQYEPYLQAIGAVEGVSDAVYGSMDWCPITGLDVADEAYEWMMGCTRSDLSEDDRALSDGLAAKFAAWVNAAGITDKEGVVLELAESEEGVYQAGSYYELVRQTIEGSLNNFLADTEFPYDSSSAGSGGGMHGAAGMEAGMGGPGGDGGPQNGTMPEGGPGNGERPEGMPEDLQDGQQAGQNASAFEEMDNISRNQTSGGLSLSGTYETAADYIAALNQDSSWVTYDETSNTATITSVADFCTALKQASKSLGAFDQLDRGQGENTLFGENGDPSHFDSLMAEVLEELGNDAASEYAEDLAKTDGLGVAVPARVNMYTPLYYLLSSSEGFGQSEPAKRWRIRTGINQGDTALTTELNLALALEADSRVESVDFATVWGQGHTQAERTGSADENFISWVVDCMA